MCKDLNNNLNPHLQFQHSHQSQICNKIIPLEQNLLLLQHKKITTFSRSSNILP